MAYSIRLRNDTRQNWFEKNPILAEGEVGIEFHNDYLKGDSEESNRVKIKVGDGVHPYANLEYVNYPIRYSEDIINKPKLNNMEIDGEKSLEYYGIQPLGSYITMNTLDELLVLKADVNNTYSKAEVDNLFKELVKVPEIGSNTDKFLKIDSNGVLYWSPLAENIYTKSEMDDILNLKVDSIEGYGLISKDEIERLSVVKNYDDEPLQNTVKELQEQVIMKAYISDVEENYVSKKTFDSTLSEYISQSEFSTKADASVLTEHKLSTNNPHNVTKTQIGLENVDNTSDENKPISKATQEALDKKMDSFTPYYGIELNESGQLINTLPNVNADWNADKGSSYIFNKPMLKAVATSNNYEDLDNKPAINGINLTKNTTTTELGLDLPIASTDVLGGVRLGEGFAIDENGVISFSYPDSVKNYYNLENKPTFKVLDESTNEMEDKVLVAGATLEDYDIASSKWAKSELELKANATDVYNKAYIDSELANIMAGNTRWGKIVGSIFSQTDLYDILTTKADISTISKVGFSGSYADLLNTPDLTKIIQEYLTTNNYTTVSDLNTLDTSLKSLMENEDDKLEEKIDTTNTKIDSVNSSLKSSINTKADKSTTYTKTEVNSSIADYIGNKFQVVDSLPTNPDPNVFYFIKE